MKVVTVAARAGRAARRRLQRARNGGGAVTGSRSSRSCKRCIGNRTLDPGWRHNTPHGKCQGPQEPLPADCLRNPHGPGQGGPFGMGRHPRCAPCPPPVRWVAPPRLDSGRATRRARASRVSWSGKEGGTKFQRKHKRGRHAPQDQVHRKSHPTPEARPDDSQPQDLSASVNSANLSAQVRVAVLAHLCIPLTNFAPTHHITTNTHQ